MLTPFSMQWTIYLVFISVIFPVELPLTPILTVISSKCSQWHTTRRWWCGRRTKVQRISCCTHSTQYNIMLHLMRLVYLYPRKNIFGTMKEAWNWSFFWASETQRVMPTETDFFWFAAINIPSISPRPPREYFRWRNKNTYWTPSHHHTPDTDQEKRDRRTEKK